MTTTIDVEQLRIGMYVHLDGGWWSHPFPRSSFRIASEEQLATLRGLGLRAVRWSPERSDPLPADGAPLPGGAATGGVAAPAGPGDAAEAVTRADPAEASLQGAATHREALARQREAMQRCQRRYGEAAQSWRAMRDAVGARPEKAREALQGLAQQMLDELLGDDDVAIRLVHSSGGDRAAAHALNVSVISLLIGRALALPADEMLDLGMGALLHDVGKLALPDRLRHPDETFSAAEFAGWREHVAQGVTTGRRMGLAPGALAVLAQHHEHADGTGFPQRLGSGRISALARIVSIVDRYDNLCNPPPRTPVLTPHEAVSTLFAQGRTRFDASILAVFIRMMGVYPAGSLVQLTDDRYAMVVGVNSTRPLKPRVLVHEHGASRAEALLLNLEEQPDLGIRRSLPPAKLPSPVLEFLDPKPRVAYYFEALAGAAPARNGAAQELAA